KISITICLYVLSYTDLFAILMCYVRIAPSWLALKRRLKKRANILMLAFAGYRRGVRQFE
ncbi:MAG: hypothetical protein PVF82_04465, partial [Gammaproteobacteria bacterium]